MPLNTSFIALHSTSLEIVIYALLITTLWFLESLFMTASLKDKYDHTLNNIKFIAMALPVQLLMTFPLLKVSSIMGDHHWGILFIPLISAHPLLKYFLGFIMLDFLDYWYHVIMHKTKPLWNFHLVHHADKQMDVTTTVREHPGETFFRTGFLVIWVGITGAGLGLLLLRQTFQTIVNVSSHTGFRLSEKADKWIGYVFVTPNIHHVHHHFELPYTDCNYGDVLSIWDRLFGTYRKLEYEDTVFGLDTHINHEGCNSYLPALMMSFEKKVDLMD